MVYSHYCNCNLVLTPSVLPTPPVSPSYMLSRRLRQKLRAGHDIHSLKIQLVGIPTGLNRRLIVNFVTAEVLDRFA